MPKSRHLPKPEKAWRRQICRWLAGSLGILLVTAGILALYIGTYQPDRRIYPIRGIDISHHQGKIDWQRVAADDIAFAYIKASEGGDYTDPAFVENSRQAQAAGIAVGAYHFFTLCRSGSDQARHFLAVLRAARDDHSASEDLPPDDLPPVIDLEFGGNCSSRPTPAALKAEIASFMDLVEGATGRALVIYATDEFRASYGAALPNRPRWVRSVFAQPADDDWMFWQYHNAGYVAGIREWNLFGWNIGDWGIGQWRLGGRVDLDVYCGDALAWRRQVSTFRN